ncbi:MAG: FliI/YscN family ATPase [Acidobacteriota bacterium]
MDSFPSSSIRSRRGSSPNSEKVDLSRFLRLIDTIETLPVSGRVTKADGLTIESDGPPVSVGQTCEVIPEGRRPIEVEVVGFRNHSVVSMPIYDTGGVKLGDLIRARGQQACVEVGASMLGRVLDGCGKPLDGKGSLDCDAVYPLTRESRNPLERRPVKMPLGTGVRCIDGLLTVGRGQRMGIFGGSGVGKSTLLGMMARNTEADVGVIALVGERGREVNAFIQDDLGLEGLKRSVVVASTSDNPPLMRIRAALVATAIAEYFSDRGKNILLVLDSITRVAMSQREIGLAAGEPPSSKGYTPSVFSLLPRIFERAGNFENGSITGFYTVLVEGDDMNEPVADAVRGLLDGHIVLSRPLAWKNHFPAIDVLQSLSRLMPALAPPAQLEASGKLRDLLSTYHHAADLIDVGAYHAGSNPKIDLAIEKQPVINSYLRQARDAEVTRESALESLLKIMS